MLSINPINSIYNTSDVILIVYSNTSTVIY